LLYYLFRLSQGRALSWESSGRLSGTGKFRTELETAIMKYRRNIL